MRGLWSMKLFRVLGIQLELHITFLLLLLWFFLTGWAAGGWTESLSWVGGLLVIFTCVVLHELGHCVAARHYGVPILRILLLPIGGMAQFGAIPRDPKKELVITLAGPLVNFAIVLLVAPFVDPPWGWPNLLFWAQTGLLPMLFFFNLAMGLFNLLPLFPMDGGRILRAMLATRLSYLRATKWAVYVARPLLLLGIGYVVFYQQNFLTAALFAFIYLGGDLEYKLVRQREAWSGQTLGDVMRGGFRVLDVTCHAGDLPRPISTPYPDIVLRDAEGPRGILPGERALEIARELDADEPLLPLADRVAQVVHTSWPVAIFLEFFKTQDMPLLPVMEGKEIVGLVDLPSLRERFGDSSRHNPGFLSDDNDRA